MWNDTNSKVTVELRELVESGIDIWAFDYPSFYKDEDKKTFEQKVIDHYFFRQIGQETPARWLHYFRTRVREIMPYFIQLYKSVELMEAVEDPFEAYNLTEEFEQQTTGTGSVRGSTGDNSTTTGSGSTTRNASSETERNANTNAEKRFSNTPQGSIDNIDNYLTEATVDATDVLEGSNVTEEGSETSENENTTVSEGHSETSSEDAGTVKSKLTRRGNIGVQPLGAEINAYRSALINVDLMVIEELNDLFLKVY